MPDVSNRNRETSTGKAGRFATEQRADPGLHLTAGPAGEPPLTTTDIERARKVHGTAYADATEGYYELMDRVFKLARLAAAPDPKPEARQAVIDRSRLFLVQGFTQDTVKEFYEEVCQHKRGSEDWKQWIGNYADWHEADPQELMELDAGLREAEAEAAQEYNAKRREELTALKARIDAELAALGA